MLYDVIVVGGSYAGMAAALQLLRARRQVLIVDAGERRNRFAAHSHGFLGQDGADPAVIARQAASSSRPIRRCAGSTGWRSTQGRTTTVYR